MPEIKCPSKEQVVAAANTDPAVKLALEKLLTEAFSDKFDLTKLAFNNELRVGKSLFSSYSLQQAGFPSSVDCLMSVSSIYGGTLNGKSFFLTGQVDWTLLDRGGFHLLVPSRK